MSPLLLHRARTRTPSNEISKRTTSTVYLTCSDVIKRALKLRDIEDDHLINLIARVLYDTDTIILTIEKGSKEYHWLVGFIPYLLENCKRLDRYTSIKATMKKYMK